MANPDPTINFRVDLTLNMNEKFGQNGGSTGVLNPDRHDEDQNRAQTNVAQRRNYLSTFIPSLRAAGNRALKHGDTFTAYGQEAIYLRDMYTTSGRTGSPFSGMTILKVV